MCWVKAVCSCSLPIHSAYRKLSWLCALRNNPPAHRPPPTAHQHNGSMGAPLRVYCANKRRAAEAAGTAAQHSKGRLPQSVSHYPRHLRVRRRRKAVQGAEQSSKWVEGVGRAGRGSEVEP